MATRSRSRSQKIRRKKPSREQHDNEQSEIDNLRKKLEAQHRSLEEETYKLKRQRKKISNLSRGLKDAIIDSQRAMNYFRNQTEEFKNAQTEWIIKNGKYAMKYIWADDIKKVRLRRQNKGGGMKIWFHDGDSSIFTDIDVWRDVFNDHKYSNEYRHDELILEIINQIKRQMQEDIVLHNEHLQLHQEQHKNSEGKSDESADESSEEEQSDEDDLLEMLIATLLIEMEERMSDMCKLDRIFAEAKQDGNKMKSLKEEYVRKIERRHGSLMKYNELELNNARWREFLLQQLPIDIVSSLYGELECRIKDLKVCKNILLDGSGDKSELLKGFIDDIKLKRHDLMFSEWDSHRYDTIQSVMKKNNKRWRKEIMETINEIYNGMEHKLTDMEQKLFDAEQEIDELKHQISDNNQIGQKLFDAEQEIDELKHQISENSEQFNFALHELEEQLVDYDNTYKELELEYENMQKTHQFKYETQKEKFTKINQLISDNLTDTKQALSALENEYENTKQTHQIKIDALNNEFETEIGKIKKTNVSLTEEMNILIRENAEKEAENEMKIKEMEIKEDECWLFTDISRSEFIDSIVINSDQEQLVKHIGGFLNRAIPTSDDLQPISLQKLYVPMDENDPKYILNACFDGVLFATLINLMQNDFLDLRALNTPNYSDEQVRVLTNEEIKENMSVIFSSVRALDICQFPSGTNPISDYFDSTHTLDILLYIAMSLFNGYLNTRINLKSYPELIRLCKNDTEKQDSQNISWTQWLGKWLVFMKEDTQLRRRKSSLDLSHSSQEIISGGLTAVEYEDDIEDEYGNGFEEDEDEVEEKMEFLMENKTRYNTIKCAEDYHKYIVMVCSKLDQTFDIKAVNTIIGNNKINNDFTGYQLIMKCIKNKIGIQNTLNITINDIGNHNYLLQQILLAEMFMTNNLIKKITLSEEKNIKQIIGKIKKDDKSIIAWINSFGWNQNLRVTNLDRDFSDGIVILKLLNECKKSVVKWRNVRKRSKIRHKFDKLANCKMIMEICDDEFDFILVGIDGTDIVHMNQKYIKTLLWQIKLYQQTKLINLRYNNDSQNKHRMITDQDMLVWSNERIVKYKQNNSENDFIKNEIISLKEPSLSDSIYFLNLISSINEKWVNYELIHEIASMNKNGNDGEYKKKRRANARYLLTIIRRLGQNIFISVDNICRVEQRAVVSVIAAIMTINAKQSQDI